MGNNQPGQASSIEPSVIGSRLDEVPAHLNTSGFEYEQRRDGTVTENLLKPPSINTVSSVKTVSRISRNKRGKKSTKTSRKESVFSVHSRASKRGTKISKKKSKRGGKKKRGTAISSKNSRKTGNPSLFKEEPRVRTTWLHAENHAVKDDTSSNAVGIDMNNYHERYGQLGTKLPGKVKSIHTGHESWKMEYTDLTASGGKSRPHKPLDSVQGESIFATQDSPPPIAVSAKKATKAAKKEKARQAKEQSVIQKKKTLTKKLSQAPVALLPPYPLEDTKTVVMIGEDPNRPTNPGLKNKPLKKPSSRLKLAYKVKMDQSTLGRHQAKIRTMSADTGLSKLVSDGSKHENSPVVGQQRKKQSSVKGVVQIDKQKSSTTQYTTLLDAEASITDLEAGSLHSKANQNNYARRKYSTASKPVRTTYNRALGSMIEVTKDGEMKDDDSMPRKDSRAVQPVDVMEEEDIDEFFKLPPPRVSVYSADKDPFEGGAHSIAFSQGYDTPPSPVAVLTHMEEQPGEAAFGATVKPPALPKKTGNYYKSKHIAIAIAPREVLSQIKKVQKKRSLNPGSHFSDFNGSEPDGNGFTEVQRNRNYSKTSRARAGSRTPTENGGEGHEDEASQRTRGMSPTLIEKFDRIRTASHLKHHSVNAGSRGNTKALDLVAQEQVQAAVPCSQFTLNLTSAKFSSCVCGFPKTMHEV